MAPRLYDARVVDRHVQFRFPTRDWTVCSSLELLPPNDAHARRADRYHLAHHAQILDRAFLDLFRPSRLEDETSHVLLSRGHWRDRFRVRS